MDIQLFGTDGIRGTVGKSPFTVYELEKLGRACAQWACETYQQNPTILLGHDTRISCSLVKSAFKSGFLQYPINLIDGGVLSTPAICQLVHYKPEFDCGIIISASHNPYQDNGIKIVTAKHGKLREQDEKYITHLFTTLPATHNYTTLGTEATTTALNDTYKEILSSFFPKNFLNNVAVVLDCAHGATTDIAASIFNSFGATVTTINSSPNGININKNCGAVHPQALQKEVVRQKADVGFAFDGDGDRVIAVNRWGQLKNGDDIIALLAQHPHYRASSGIVGTTMSNKGLENFVLSLGKNFVRTAVGDKHVSQALQSNNFIVGGEPSGHIVLRDYLPIGDGIFSALRVLETMLTTHNHDMTTFHHMPQIMLNIPLSINLNLKKAPFDELIALATSALPEGRLVVRQSGTEPLLRIMVENPDFEYAQGVAQSLANNIKKTLKGYDLEK